MNTYYVTYPTVGEVTVTVEAESEDAAIDRGWDLIDGKAEHEWEPVEHIVQGNVFYGTRNEITVEEEGE